MKTRLDISLQFHSNEMNDVRIPIEVRDEQMRLIARALSPASLNVESAQYIVTATLPAGQSMTQIVDATGDAQRVVLQPLQEEQSPNEWQEAAHYAASARAQRAATGAAKMFRNIVAPRLAAPVPSPKPPAWIRVFAGNVLAGVAVPQPHLLKPGSCEPGGGASPGAAGE